jgi:glycosyltransferase involved in cell wall biosynthesis
MMGAWAWNHHRLRKQLCSLFVHPGAIAAAAGWHATSAAEADDIRRQGITRPVCVAPNGVEAPTAAQIETARRYWLDLVPAAARRPVALFYSRFHSKKRVKELIDLWAATATGDWLLLVVGLAEEFDEAGLAAHAHSTGAGDRILVLAGEDRPAPYAISSLFVLPSHNENFGMSIAEAMAHAVPALVTDTTPWSDLPRLGLGFCPSWERFPATLTAALAEGAESLRERGMQARQWVLSEFSWLKSAALLRDFYATLTP